MTTKIITSSNADKEYVTEQLMAFNRDFLPLMSKQEELVPLNFYIQNSAGKMIAGVNACMVYKATVKVDILWVDEKYRNNDYGSQLLQHVEQQAKDAGASLIHLDTFDFQARGFYEKCGYEVFATLEDSPAKGNKRFYMKKIL